MAASEIPDSVFMKHIRNYNILKFNVNSVGGFSNHLLKHSKNIEMSYEIILFLVFWFCKIYH